MPVVDREKEREIVKRARERGWSDEQIKEAVLKFREQAGEVAAPAPVVAEPEPVERGFLSAVAESAKERFAGAKEAFGRIIERPGEERVQTPVETSLQVVGEGFGFLGDVLGEGVVRGIKAVTPDKVEEAIATKAREILSTPQGKTALQVLSQGVEDYEAWKGENPRAAANVEAVVDISSLLPVERAVTLGVKPAVTAARRGAAELAETTAETAAEAARRGVEAGRVVRGAAEEIIPTTEQVVGRQITQALDLTPGDISNIRNSTGNDVGDFVARNNLIGGNKKETLDAVDNFFSENYAQVREEIGKVTKSYTSEQVTRYEDALNVIKKQIADTPGLEADNATVDALLKKRTFNLNDIQETKELLDEHFSLYRVTGDPKIGAAKEGIRKIRQELREFIEKEVLDTTGADIKKLNNNVATARSVADATELRAPRGITRKQVSLSDLGTLGFGAAVNPLLGVAALFVKKLLESPTIKLKFARWLDGLSDAKKAAVKKQLQAGELPEGLPKEIRDVLEDAEAGSGLEGLKKRD